MKPRPVTIKEHAGSYLVSYTNRKPRQRHLAAQFHKSMRTLAQVKQWVRDNPKLTLV